MYHDTKYILLFVPKMLRNGPPSFMNQTIPGVPKLFGQTPPNGHHDFSATLSLDHPTSLFIYFFSIPGS